MLCASQMEVSLPTGHELLGMSWHRSQASQKIFFYKGLAFLRDAQSTDQLVE